MERSTTTAARQTSRRRWLGAVTVVLVMTMISCRHGVYAAGHKEAPKKPPKLAQAVVYTKEMVVSASAEATAAGEMILAMGGTAADAMIAVQTVLGLVEPQSSGIAGGAFLVWYDGQTQKMTTYDARETAPASATPDMFLRFNDSFEKAWQTGLAVGVSGVPKLLEKMYQLYGGGVDWSDLFQPAIDLAKHGYEMTERMHENAAELLDTNIALNYTCPNQKLFFRDPLASKLFLKKDGCTPKDVGTVLHNPDYARLMEGLGQDGSDFYYHGDVANAIVAAVRTDPHVPGNMTLADLAGYDIVEREPVCCDYKHYHVCGMGPPSSGGLAICQQLGILATFPNFADSGDLLNEQVVHRVAMAGKLSYVVEKETGWMHRFRPGYDVSFDFRICIIDWHPKHRWP